MHRLACLCVLLSFLEEVGGTCPSRCACDGSEDGAGPRSVLCNDPDMTEVPTNFPVDTVKLRIERTAVRRVPAEAFYYLVDLQFLWATCNSVASLETGSFYNLGQLHELRLAGNALATFPWASLQDTPQLRTLDLHNNRIASVPKEAIRHLTGLAYLDLSSNRLTTLPPDFLESWSHVLTSSRSLDPSPRRMILGLQDNPWLCDCHISKLIELSKIAAPTVMFLDPLMVCSEPESLAGILFQRAELEKCLKPLVMTSATQITSALGSNILLRCDATGQPTPQLTWTRADSALVNYTVIQESPGEGIRWSIMSLPGISTKDAGDYKCKAKNLAGSSEAVVTVTVLGGGSAVSPDSPGETGDRSGQEVHTGPRRPMSTPGPSSTAWPPSSFASSTPLYPVTPFSPSSMSFSSPPSASTLSTSISISASTVLADQQPLLHHLDGKSDSKVERSGNALPAASTSEKEELSEGALPVGTDATVENVRVASQTRESVTLTWNVVNPTPNWEVTVSYSKFGEEAPRLLITDSSKNQVTLEGLVPGGQYLACVCLSGTQPHKDQCVTFATDSAEGGTAPGPFLVLSAIACGIILPVLFFLLYKVCKLQCKSDSFWEDDLTKETYIQFETPSPRRPSIGEPWVRKHRDDCEKLLLCSRSSVESQAPFKSEASRPDYYC
ncbi:PREDICTED: leucine-rich repeat, immunoglobulin-like domain and transmembrane domain-containing protein 3 [Condylura cristata]|uniref:leucine-rich repeat, immunoglobulin-like domain and transmembrane domain-containing protein 3 n=1 Tax=Condylura cristata TaxID=143302 RepID=UPI00033435ED|nr:PREDICTED: leucine-rich repeat, immunoglobulin-like domain and transmembrane domain-containing protein 3 [Condylura cristata]